MGDLIWSERCFGTSSCGYNSSHQSGSSEGGKPSALRQGAPKVFVELNDRGESVLDDFGPMLVREMHRCGAWRSVRHRRTG